jgi:integrase
MLLSEWVARYCDMHLGLSSGGATQLNVAVRRMEAWRGNPVALEELSADAILGFLRSCLSSGQSPATVKSKRTSLLTLWRAAAREGLAPPVESVPTIKVPQRLPEAWTVEEITRLLAECRKVRGSVGPTRARDWWPALVLVCYDSGERIGALKAIQLDDFAPTHSSVIVRAAHQKGRMDRVFPLSAETVAACERLHQHDCDCELLFPYPFRRETLWRQFRRIVERAGLSAPKGRMNLFHKIRRSSGTLIESNGGDGSRHLGNSRAVFERSYLDPRIVGNGQLDFLPRPAAT